MPGSANPYVPWDYSPAGALIGPLALLSMLYRRKKGKRGTTEPFLIVLVFAAMVMSVGMACAIGGGIVPTQTPHPSTNNSSTQTHNPGNTQTPDQPPTTTPTVPSSCSGCTVQKTAYLTFDDGGYVTDIAQSLNSQGMPSTFFVNGNVNSAAANTIKGYGHAIGLHGWTHPVQSIPPESDWWNPYFNVYKDITQLKNTLAGSLGGVIMLRAPGGNFAPRDIFHNSQKWLPYQNAYFYGWDIQPRESGSLGDEPGTLEENLINGPDHAIILLHSNNSYTLAAVQNGKLKATLNSNCYCTFSVLPGNRGDHTGYDPIGTFASWVVDGNRDYTHYEDDGKTPILWP